MKYLAYAIVLMLCLSGLLLCVPGTKASTTALAIMRPTSDYLYNTWDVWPVSPTTEYDKLDESTNGSDEDDTYVYNDDMTTSYAYYECSDVDIPAAYDYSITMWAIARRTSAYSGVYIYFGVYHNTSSTMTAQTYLTTSWVNYTFDIPVSPNTDENWTAQDLNYTCMKLNGYGISTSAVLVSQIGIVVYFSGETPPEYEEPGTGPGPWNPGDLDLGPFRLDMVGVMGFVGFVGMIAVPAATVYMYRRGSDSVTGAFITGLVSFMFCFTLFLVSLN